MDQSAERDRTHGGSAIKEMPTFRGGVEIALIAEVGHGPSLFGWLTYSRSILQIPSPQPCVGGPQASIYDRRIRGTIVPKPTFPTTYDVDRSQEWVIRHGAGLKIWRPKSKFFPLGGHAGEAYLLAA